jgi:hypothetical protein
MDLSANAAITASTVHPFEVPVCYLLALIPEQTVLKISDCCGEVVKCAT